MIFYRWIQFAPATVLATALLLCCNPTPEAQTLDKDQGGSGLIAGIKSRLKTEGFRAAALPDKGIWPDLDPKVAIRAADWLDPKSTSIIVDKQHRLLSIAVNGVPVATYPIALGFSPTGHKQVQGDGKTPEGTYSVCERLHKKLAPRYGARSLRLSYPNTQDARSALAVGTISPAQKRAIASAIEKGSMPPQNTPLGGSIRIHGGGVGRDWTLGCIAMRDPDIIDLYAQTAPGARVQVLGKEQKPSFSDRDRDGIPDQVDVLLGAKKLVINGAQYDGRYIRIPPKGGDVPRKIGVCTDVIIRALRNAGLDLQVEVQKDRAKSPAAYPRIKSPDPSIDHRRVKNLVPWFERHWQSMPTDDFATYLPGDVILMDTLSYEGPDHCGIISDRLGPSGRPMVINNWTVGYQTQEMDLLEVVPVLGHFRWK